MRIIAAEASGMIRPRDEAVVEALQSRIQDTDLTARRAVAEALEKFKKKGND
jgi:hypothetical protein